MSRVIIDELSEDHGNIARILNLLEAQLAAFRADRDPDYTLMSDAMHYIIHYQDLFHHPKEDIMLGKLTTRDPGVMRYLSSPGGRLCSVYRPDANLKLKLKTTAARRPRCCQKSRSLPLPGTLP